KKINGFVGLKTKTIFFEQSGGARETKYATPGPTVAPLPGAAAKELVRGARRGGYFKRLLEVLR
ncbi:hypothetical protein PWJ82_08110, partial [Actinotignum schaalii]|uniref:hypothetical protein n=1 Tax=Actinotignum schaalii TaxID=59505 RepID=UPI00237E3C94